jgi:hypothetical protein
MSHNLLKFESQYGLGGHTKNDLLPSITFQDDAHSLDYQGSDSHVTMLVSLAYAPVGDTYQVFNLSSAPRLWAALSAAFGHHFSL